MSLWNGNLGLGCIYIWWVHGFLSCEEKKIENGMHGFQWHGNYSNCHRYCHCTERWNSQYQLYDHTANEVIKALCLGFNALSSFLLKFSIMWSQNWCYVSEVPSDSEMSQGLGVLVHLQSYLRPSLLYPVSLPTCEWLLAICSPAPAQWLLPTSPPSGDLGAA